MQIFKSKFKIPWAVLSSGILFIFLLCVPAVWAEASSFTHSHSDSCYEKVTHTCTNHHIESVTEETDHWCVHCQAWPSSDVTSYYEVCDSGLIPKVLLGQTVFCNECRKYTTYFAEPEITPHTYETTEFVCKIKDGECMADVSCSLSSAAWTNGSVEIKCDVSVKNGSFSLASAPYDWGKGFTSDETFIATDNGTYDVTVKDSQGNTVSASATVSCIDKVAPSVKLKKSTDGWSEEGIDIIAEASDEQSGLSDNPYALDGGAFGTESVWHIDKNGTYSVTVCDRAGNIATETIVIDRIGRDPEVVAAEAKKAEEERMKAEEERLKAEADARAAQAEREAEEERRKAAEYEAARAAEESNRLAQEARIAEEQTKKAEAEAQKAKANKEKAKAEQEKAEAEKAKAEAEAKAAEEERLKAEAELIKVTDMTIEEPEVGEMVIEEQPVPEATAENPLIDEIIEEPVLYDFSNIQGENYVEESIEPEIRKASLGVSVIYAGVFLAICGVAFFSFFNYVYVCKNGHIHVMALVKLKVENGNVLVLIPDGKVKEPGRYMLYFSPWSKSKLKKRGVYVKNGTSPTVIPVDEGKVFSIKG